MQNPKGFVRIRNKGVICPNIKWSLVVTLFMHYSYCLANQIYGSFRLTAVRGALIVSHRLYASQQNVLNRRGEAAVGSFSNSLVLARLALLACFLLLWAISEKEHSIAWTSAFISLNTKIVVANLFTQTKRTRRENKPRPDSPSLLRERSWRRMANFLGQVKSFTSEIICAVGTLWKYMTDHSLNPINMMKSGIFVNWSNRPGLWHQKCH